MSESKGVTPKGGGRLPSLDKFGGIKKALAKIARSLWRNEIEESKARSLTYILGTLSSVHRIEAEVSLENRVAALEKQVAEEESRDGAPLPG